MGKKQRKKLARQIVKQVLRELGKMPAPAPAGRTIKQKAAEILETARAHVRVSAALAGFDDATADAMFEAGFTPHTAARAFSNALQREQ